MARSHTEPLRGMCKGLGWEKIHPEKKLEYFERSPRTRFSDDLSIHPIEVLRLDERSECRWSPLVKQCRIPD